MKQVVAAVTAALAILAFQATAALGSTDGVSKTFPNCKALNKVYPHGVGKVGARDKTTGDDRVTNFKRSNKLYRENKARDRDKDGVACEKA